MLNLLETQNPTGSNWVTLLIMIAAVVGIAVMWILSGKRRKKQEDETKKIIDAVKPGNKVKTIGGICGIVVEVNAEENTFVLETGSEATGKSFIKFVKQAIYETDAVPEKEEVKEQEVSVEVKETSEVKDEVNTDAENTKENDTSSKKSKKN